MKQALTPEQAEALRLLKSATLEVSSEPPPSEPQGQRERSGLATCSLPVSLVEKTARRLQQAAQIASQCGCALSAEDFTETANQLRAELARANERRPEENKMMTNEPPLVNKTIPMKNPMVSAQGTHEPRPHKARWVWHRVRRFFTRRWVLLSPKDPVLFSERYGYRKPVLKLGGWRIIAAVEMGDHENMGLVAERRGQPHRGSP